MISLCQFKQGCFGCCGNNYTSEKDVVNTIWKSTGELKLSSSPKEFRDRFPKELVSSSGLCKNFVKFEDGNFGCGIHPARVGLPDLRIGHCDHDYLCQTMRTYLSWDDNQKQKFLDWLEKNNLSLYDYSLGMDEGTLLTQFQNEN